MKCAWDRALSPVKKKKTSCLHASVKRPCVTEWGTLSTTGQDAPTDSTSSTQVVSGSQEYRPPDFKVTGTCLSAALQTQICGEHPTSLPGTVSASASL